VTRKAPQVRSDPESEFLPMIADWFDDRDPVPVPSGIVCDGYKMEADLAVDRHRGGVVGNGVAIHERWRDLGSDPRL
jgi:hypothetical protein